MEKVNKEDLTVDCRYRAYDEEGEVLEVSLVEVFDDIAVVEADEIGYLFEVSVNELYESI